MTKILLAREILAKVKKLDHRVSLPKRIRSISAIGRMRYRHQHSIINRSSLPWPGVDQDRSRALHDCDCSNADIQKPSNFALSPHGMPVGQGRFAINIGVRVPSKFSSDVEDQNGCHSRDLGVYIMMLGA